MPREDCASALSGTRWHCAGVARFTRDVALHVVDLPMASPTTPTPPRDPGSEPDPKAPPDKDPHDPDEAPDREPPSREPVRRDPPAEPPPTPGDTPPRIDDPAPIGQPPKIIS
jgi:hypothetical protein